MSDVCLHLSVELFYSFLKKGGRKTIYNIPILTQKKEKKKGWNGYLLPQAAKPQAIARWCPNPDLLPPRSYGADSLPKTVAGMQEKIKAS